jgi:hypothetical protein
LALRVDAYDVAAFAWSEKQQCIVEWSLLPGLPLDGATLLGEAVGKSGDASAACMPDAPGGSGSASERNALPLVLKTSCADRRFSSTL